MTFTQAQERLLQHTVIAASGFGAVSAVIVCTLHVIVKNLRQSFTSRLLFYVSITDLIAGIGNFLSLIDLNTSSFFCYVQAYAQSAGFTASILWSTVIAHSMFVRVVLLDQRYQRYEKWYHIGIWSVTLVLTVLPQFWNAYGFAGGWCWITTAFWSFRFIQFYGPLLLCYLVIIVIYIIVFVSLIRATRAAHKSLSERKAVFLQMAIYPFLFLISWISGCLNRFYELVHKQPHFVFALLAAIFTGNGVLNLLAYLFLNRRTLRDFFDCRRCRKNANRDSEAERGAAPKIGEISTPRSRRPSFDLEPVPNPLYSMEGKDGPT